MKLMLDIITDTGRNLGSKTLEQTPVTIGRSKDNDIVLEDEKRFISHHHAIIEYRSPDFFLTDTSTNGVLVNDALQPLGKGNSTRLSDNDELHIGDYILRINFGQKSNLAEVTGVAADPLNEEALSFDDDPFADFGEDSVQQMIEENQLVPDDWSGVKKTDDELFAFDIPDQSDQDEDLLPSREMNRTAAVKEAFEPFQGNKKENDNASGQIFDEDWFSLKPKENSTVDKDPFDLDFFAKEPERSTTQAIESAPVVEKEPEPSLDIAPKAAPVQPLAETATQGTATANDDFEQALAYFLKGAGVSSAHLQQNLDPKAFYIIGKILRASVQGTIDVLIGRAKIKNEMHLDVTMIRSKQNNPIKFSVSAEEAIKKLLAPEDEGYLPAEEAIDEVFDDIRAHQFSMIAGMQAALLEVLKRFDPDKLEQRLQQESPISASIPVHKQAKLWRLFQHLYEDIEHEATDNFYHLFGQVFAETYQDQINQLKRAKKNAPI